MAKGGTNLNPGADATLVQAAYAASMANVPKDLSKTFDSLARSYDATMKSVAQSYSEIAEKIVPLAANMVKNAIKKGSLENKYNSHLITKSANFGDEGVLSQEDWAEQNKDIDPSADMTYDKYLKELPQTQISVHDLLTNIRNEQRKHRGKNNDVSKKRMIELKGEKQQIYNELEFLGKADQANVNLLQSGTVDEMATGQINMVLSAAIQQYTASSGKIQEEGPYKGYYVDLGNNTDKEFTFTLKAPNGDIITGENPDGTLQTGGDTPISVPSSGVANLFTTKYSQENINGVNAIFDGLLKQSKTPYSSINVGNKLKAFVNNENDLFGAMEVALGSHPSSFVEELNSPSETSAAYFASLGKVKLKELGVKDADGDGTIGDAGDFIAGNAQSKENYDTVKSKLLNKRDKKYSFKDTQKAFLAYGDTVGQKMHNYQPTITKNPNKNPVIKTETDIFASIGDTKSLQLSGVFVNKGELESKRTLIQQRRGFPIGNDILFNPKGENGWVKIKNNKEIREYNSVSDLIKNGLKTSHPGFTSLITMDVNEDGIPDIPYSLDFLNKKYYNLVDKK